MSITKYILCKKEKTEWEWERMSQQHNCPCAPGCALQSALESIGGKWKLPLLCSLTADGPTRYNDLLRKMRGISNTILAKSLRELERDGLVERQEYLEVPVRVEYAVTERARTLQPVLHQLIQWQMETK